MALGLRLLRLALFQCCACPERPQWKLLVMLVATRGAVKVGQATASPRFRGILTHTKRLVSQRGGPRDAMSTVEE